MFCTAMRRSVYTRLGPLDERFKVGLFEDDDYSMRARVAGYRIVCAEDVFVHHFGQASLGQLAAAGVYGQLFHANRTRWEDKWGQAWQPYVRRPTARYKQLQIRLRRLVLSVLPADATVLVVSKGDEELLKLGSRVAQHFPQDSGGGYVGYYPADSNEAITQLESLRSNGARYLVFPETALWWLEHYAEFARHLERCYSLLVSHQKTGLIFDLHAARTINATRRQGKASLARFAHPNEGSR
jgi:hypothetical protein